MSAPYIREKKASNFYLLPVTIDRIDVLAAKTHRGRSNVVDWAIELAFQQLPKQDAPTADDHKQEALEVVA